MAGSNDTCNWTVFSANQTDCYNLDTQHFTGAISMPFVVRVVGSQLERIVFQMYLTASILSATVFNVFLLVVIARDSRLCSPEKMIIGFDSINNLAVTVFGSCRMMWLNITGACSGWRGTRTIILCRIE